MHVGVERCVGLVGRWYVVCGEVAEIAVVGVVVREVNGAVVMECLLGMPVAQRKFCGNGTLVLKLLKFCVSVVFSLGDASAGRANVGVTALVVLVSRNMLVVVEFDVDCIGVGESVVMVCVGCDVEL